MSESPENVCRWRPSKSQPEAEAGAWDTDCGEQHIFFVDGPKENKCRFCCYCGRPLKEKRA